MALFIEIRSINPRRKQNEIAKELGYSSSTLQRYRKDKKCKVLINQTILGNINRPQMTSK